MTATLGQGRDFTAITITDRNDATLTIERGDDGRTSMWIAEPGFNDGHSVLLDLEDAVAVSAFLAGRDVELLPHLITACRQAAVYADEVGRLTAELARMRAESQEPCDICSSTGSGCPDCQQDAPTPTAVNA